MTTISPSYNDRIEAIALQADGRIVAAGETHDGSQYDFAVARYHPDGSLDDSFGDDGLVTTGIDSDDQTAYGTVIQPDGKIVIVGGSTFESWVVRYNPDGTLDTTFDSDGIVLSPVPAFDVALQQDGRIVVAGGSSDFAFARFSAEGALDTSFGGDGVVTVPVPGLGATAFALVIQPDGKILAGGSAGDAYHDSILVRLRPGGALDPTFGDGGIVITEVGIYLDKIYALALQADFSIVAAGQNFTSAFVARYLPDGSLDIGFSEDGIVSFSYSDETGTSIARGLGIQSDGKIVAGGEAPDYIGTDFGLSRFNLDGSFDVAFGSDGKVITDLSQQDGGFALAIQPDGKILLGGQGDRGSRDLAIARYFPEALTGLGGRSDFNGDGLEDLAVGVPWEDVGGDEDTGAFNVLYATDSGLASSGNQSWDESSTGSATNDFLDGFGFSSTSGDFDGDGFTDLAGGAPLKTIEGSDFAGAVSVLYGGAGGLTSSGSQQWHQDSVDVEGSGVAEDLFGWSLGAGDFNGDGFDDLAIGVPGEEVGGDVFAGAVNVLYGSASGLTAAGDQLWHQDSANINNKAETDDQFGLAVGTGDFDGDGYADLAVGVPTENLDNGVDAGGVNVIYGSAAGLTSAADDFWHQDVTDINNKVEDDDWFGYRVTGGDFDGDGFDDLLVGVPAEGVSGQSDAGGASVIYGSSSGLSAAGDDFWHQDSDGIANEAEEGDEFGISVSAGDFDGDGFDDAAIGVVGEDVSGKTDSGAVAVIYGTAGGLDDPNDDLWHQDSSGIEDSAQEPDLFGCSLLSGNFGNGPEDDLAIGVVWESVGSVEFAGAVNVIYGSPSDLTSTGDQFWHQDSTDILDQAESDDEFGFGLAQPGGGAGASPVPGPERRLVSPTTWILR